MRHKPRSGGSGPPRSPLAECWHYWFEAFAAYHRGLRVTEMEELELLMRQAYMAGGAWVLTTVEHIGKLQEDGASRELCLGMITTLRHELEDEFS